MRWCCRRCRHCHRCRYGRRGRQTWVPQHAIPTVPSSGSQRSKSRTTRAHAHAHRSPSDARAHRPQLQLVAPWRLRGERPHERSGRRGVRPGAAARRVRPSCVVCALCAEPLAEPTWCGEVGPVVRCVLLFCIGSEPTCIVYSGRRTHQKDGGRLLDSEGAAAAGVVHHAMATRAINSRPGRA